VIVDGWALDRVRATADLRALAEPVEQIAVLRALSETHPGDLTGLCEQLQDPARRECSHLSGRPHLWDKTQNPLGSLPAAERTDPWVDTAPIPTDCVDDSCRLDTALAAAPHDSPGICASISTQKWRDECFFRLGELARDTATGVKLCLGSGVYVDQCLGHLSRAISAPALALGDAKGWTGVGQRIAVAAAAAGPLGPRLADRLWAESLLAAYSAAERVTGDPLDLLPEQTRPHIYAAAARRLMQDEDHTGISEWTAALDDALARRGTGLRSDVRPGGVPAHWRELKPGEEGLPWVAYLRNQRRALGQSEAAERLICLLEANARRENLDRGLIEESLEHPDRLVRWTAARTAGRLKQRSIVERISGDADPLIHQRVPR